MSLLKKLQEDKLVAFKARNTEEKDLLSLLISEVTRDDKNPSDDIVQKGIKKMIENAKLCKDEYPEKILSKYLPKMLDENDLVILITSIIDDNGFDSMADMGKIMGKLKGRNDVDMKLASNTVRNLLNN